MFIDPDGNSVHWVESKTGNVYWDDNAISESTTKTGEKYLGPEGYGINEANGNVIHYGANGIASEAPMGIGDISVSGDKDVSAVRQSVYQSQRDFLTHPITQAAINTMLFVATGGVEGAASFFCTSRSLLTRSVTQTGISLWPAASSGRIVINNIEYTTHALERMQPVGTIMKGSISFSRGITPSAVENAIRFDKVTPGNTAAEVVRTFENVRVITNPQGTRVISVIKIGL